MDKRHDNSEIKAEKDIENLQETKVIISLG